MEAPQMELMEADFLKQKLKVPGVDTEAVKIATYLSHWIILDLLGAISLWPYIFQGHNYMDVAGDDLSF